jgi:uncharacterized protein YjcR
VIKPRHRWLDTEALALHYGVPQGTLRRWAHEDGWTPHGGRRTRQWDMDQVQASYDRRRHATGQAACA